MVGFGALVGIILVGLGIGVEIGFDVGFMDGLMGERKDIFFVGRTTLDVGRGGEVGKGVELGAIDCSGGEVGAGAASKKEIVFSLAGVGLGGRAFFDWIACWMKSSA